MENHRMLGTEEAVVFGTEGGPGPMIQRDALHLHLKGEHPPRRIDPRRGRKRKPGPPGPPMYQQIAAEVDQRRKACPSGKPAWNGGAELLT